MKKINKAARELFQATIDRIPAGETSCIIDDNPSKNIMALHVERIGSVRLGPLYSFAHYYKQNGDMMRDPDIIMFRAENGDFFPKSYRQDGLGIDREYIIFNDAGTGYKIAKRQQADLATFCGLWASNIADQQSVERVNGRLVFTRAPAPAVDPGAAFTLTADPAPVQDTPTLNCSATVAAWLDPDGGLQRAGLIATN